MMSSTTVEQTSVQRLAAASFIGTAIEWYDFFIYGIAAALVFNHIFFPEASPLVGTLLSFATFAVGFVARPLGAVLFGHFGDVVGRKNTLMITLTCMGAATFAIGILPSYESVGVLAPILLVVLRIVQGIAVGGEWGGAVLVATENASPKDKTLYGSFAQFGSPGGLLLATLVFTLINNVTSEDQLQSFAWRIPFLLTALLIPVGLMIRLKIAETPEFRSAELRREKSKIPVLTAFRFHRRGLIVGTFCYAGLFLTYYLLTTFVLAYATQTLGMSRSVVLPANIIAALVEAAFILVGVLIAVRWSARSVAVLSSLGLLVWSAPAFALMHMARPSTLYLAVAVAMAFVGLGYGVLAAEVSELFAPSVRYTGVSICYHLAGMIGGGFGPILATYLLKSSGSSWPVALLSAIVALAMTAACLALPRRDLIRESELFDHQTGG